MGAVDRDPQPSEDLRDEDLERVVRVRRRAAGYRTAARRALAFARRYRGEEGRAGGVRELACVKQALAWRAEARRLVTAASAPRPGLARARAASEAALAEEVARQIG
jgi:hypothetical protein